MKMLIMVIAALSLIGCSSPVREDGFCATYSYGACLLKWHNGKKVASGEVDMRYIGLSSDDIQGNFSGKVSVSVKEW
ncbi:hypothetical protein STSR3_08 [Salmonella virus STSR3]|nr:hypothetical protein STSR3_08 [Salmonella virus STSR3]